jgi:hypothetical protein
MHQRRSKNKTMLQQQGLSAILNVATEAGGFVIIEAFRGLSRP